MNRTEFFRIHKRAVFTFRMENHFTPVVIVFFGDFYRRFCGLTNGGIFTVQIAVNGGFIKRDGPALTTMFTAFPTDT